ncbi:helix-turn-helix domain-containing protein [Marinimicrobium sp. ARAG 43.8]|uniref:helix-turn-helix domain-containing protein n=1 Tax=Marinimicrobium sp. ARAG 43.8 TaxID=3418719 RepID=UPI003CFACE05
MTELTISLHSLIFNFNDLILVMAAGQYILLTVLLLVAGQHEGKVSNQLLGAFLCLKAIQSVDMLLIWSEPLRHVVLQTNPNWLFIGTALSLLQGPLLYWYVASVLYRHFRFQWQDSLHLIPALFITGALIWRYYALPNTAQVAVMTDLTFMWSPLMTHTTTLWHLSVIAYGVYAMLAITRYRDLLKQRYANVEVRKKSWLKGLIIGLLVITAWRLLVHQLGDSINYASADLLGISGNYIEFIFVNILVFTSIRYVHLFDRVEPPVKEAAQTPSQRSYTDEQIARVQRLMADQKPYLLHDITIETLSRRASIPERTLSRMLNQHFGKNFFEFINSYRIEEAKRLLADPDCGQKTILDLMNDAGFTSKSTFNTLFKKHVGQTPSQYRKDTTP